MRDKIIRINWNKPLLLNDAISSDLSNKQGLYYISRIFGEKETSLYLGIATQSNTIRNRLKDHRDHWLNRYRGRIFVRIGCVIYPRVVDKSIIEHAESAIVFEQSDIFFENTDKTNSYSYTELYRIENEGDIFELKPTIRMHEHPECERGKNDRASLIERWLNDPEPVRVMKDNGSSSERVEIKKIDNAAEYLKNKF